jgi:hypothetical protein
MEKKWFRIVGELKDKPGMYFSASCSGTRAELLRFAQILNLTNLRIVGKTPPRQSGFRNWFT